MGGKQGGTIGTIGQPPAQQSESTAKKAKMKSAVQPNNKFIKRRRKHGDLCMWMGHLSNYGRGASTGHQGLAYFYKQTAPPRKCKFQSRCLCISSRPSMQ